MERIRPKAWLVYEKMWTGDWQTVVYFQNLPSRIETSPQSTTPVELKDEDFDDFNEPIAFSILEKRYPRQGE